MTDLNLYVKVHGESAAKTTVNNLKKKLEKTPIRLKVEVRDNQLKNLEQQLTSVYKSAKKAAEALNQPIAGNAKKAFSESEKMLKNLEKKKKSLQDMLADGGGDALSSGEHGSVTKAINQLDKQIKAQKKNLESYYNKSGDLSKKAAEKHAKSMADAQKALNTATVRETKYGDTVKDYKKQMAAQKQTENQNEALAKSYEKTYNSMIKSRNALESKFTSANNYASKNSNIDSNDFAEAKNDLESYQKKYKDFVTQVDQWQKSDIKTEADATKVGNLISSMDELSVKADNVRKKMTEAVSPVKQYESLAKSVDTLKSKFASVDEYLFKNSDVETDNFDKLKGSFEASSEAYDGYLKKFEAIRERIKNQGGVTKEDVKDIEALSKPITKLTTDAETLHNQMKEAVEPVKQFDKLSESILGIETSIESKSSVWDTFVKKNADIGSTEFKQAIAQMKAYQTEYNSLVAKSAKLMTKESNGESLTKGEINELNAIKTSMQQLGNEMSRVQKQAEAMVRPIRNAENESIAFDKIGNRLTEYYNKYEHQLKKNTALYSKWQTLVNKANNGDFASIADANRQFAAFRTECRAAGIEVESLGTKLSKTFGTRIRSALAGYGVMAMQGALQDIIQNSIAVDTAMTELKKVTSETDSTYTQFLEGAEERAQRLGATLSETVNATADFARLGYSVEDASTLADVALVYQNVGDDVESIDDASSVLISSMQGLI